MLGREREKNKNKNNNVVVVYIPFVAPFSSFSLSHCKALYWALYQVSFINNTLRNHLANLIRNTLLKVSKENQIISTTKKIIMCAINLANHHFLATLLRLILRGKQHAKDGTGSHKTGEEKTFLLVRYGEYNRRYLIYFIRV